jgi:hypothetical protein
VLAGCLRSRACSRDRPDVGVCLCFWVLKLLAPPSWRLSHDVYGPVCACVQVFYVNENSAVNTFVGVFPAQPRKGEALQFNITGGNTGGAFRVQACSGTLFVDLEILDFESTTLNWFNLSVMVTGEQVKNVTAIIYVRGASLRVCAKDSMLSGVRALARLHLHIFPCARCVCV